ncbi:MAG: FG-GAP-like repeat-containing protein, partial [Bacteroidota bacterium]
DYYLVNSSFEWYPGLPIYHSRDLVNWRLIGYGVHRPDQVPLPEGLPDSRGVYAPTLRYHEGNFYLINTCVRCDSPPPRQKLIEGRSFTEFRHQEDLHVDFNLQTLLPHEYTRLGPALAVADLNGDGLEDAFLGGASGQAGRVLRQTANGFEAYELPDAKGAEDIDAIFLDVDQDGDQDLYVVSGGSVYPNSAEAYQDRLYRNNGQGELSRDSAALPLLAQSGACVRPADIDLDGDLDLLVCGRVMPGAYPLTPPTYLLRNEGGRFEVVDTSMYAGLHHLGMLTDAIWMPASPNARPQLAVVGEWTGIHFFEWQGEALVEQSTQGLEHQQGWWNSLTAGDFDEDGDLDFIAGNLGLNTNYRANMEEPLCVYAKDYDQNGSIDPILCQYLWGKEYPVASRDKLVRQITAKAREFSTYHSYAKAGFNEVFREAERQNALILQSQQLQSCYIENLGENHYKIRPLPWMMQTAPIMDFLVKDVNQDGHLDVLAVGNSYATEVKTGRYDAFTGTLMLGHGNGSFDYLPGSESGFLANQDARNIRLIKLGAATE